MRVCVVFMKPKVSVIVPCYNAEKTIGRALDSLKNQTFKGFETIVVDDGSTDRTLNVIRNNGVKIVSLKENRGVSFARNKGIEAASGDLLLFLDADCWAGSSWAENTVAALNKKGVNAAVSGVSIPKSSFFANAVAELGFPGGGNAGFENMWKVSSNGYTNHICSGNFGMEKQVLKKVGGFDESMRRAQDAYLSVILLKHNIKIKHCSGMVVYHEPMTSFKQFVRNHIMRGKANDHFQEKVGNIRPFVSLRLWSSKNILKKNLFKPRFPVVLFLLLLTFFLQQVGYVRNKLSSNLNGRRKK